VPVIDPVEVLKVSPAGSAGEIENEVAVPPRLTVFAVIA
jgi:hypothetical protein